MGSAFAAAEQLVEDGSPASQQAFKTLLIAIAVMMLARWLLGFCWNDKEDKGFQTGGSRARSVSEEADAQASAQFLKSLGAPEYPHEEGCMVPCRGLVVNNMDEMSPFENEMCSGNFLALHRATYDRKLEKSGDYRFGEYFHGKRRKWEARVQFKFNRNVDPNDLYFGIELEKYVPMNVATKQAMSIIVRMLKSVVGDQIYHSVGDDPQGTRGELELPTFVMPLWAFDQFIVTPEGQQPPHLADPDLPNMGSSRAKRVRQFKKELEELRLVPGPTYTFCFWGISQWLDKLSWKVRLPLMAPLDFNMFCGRPPVHVVIYSLTGRDGSEKRHLNSLKEYCFDLAFWSSTSRPPHERLAALLAGCEPLTVASASSAAVSGDSFSRRNGGSRHSLFRTWFGCCSTR